MSPPPQAHWALPAGFWDTAVAVGGTSLCPATRTLLGLMQRQVRGEGSFLVRDTGIDLQQRHERAAEAVGARLEEQLGIRSPEAPFQQWKIFFLTGLGEENYHPAHLAQASPRERSRLETLQPSAIMLCSQLQLPREKPVLSFPSSGSNWPWLSRLQNQPTPTSSCPGEMLCPSPACICLQGLHSPKANKAGGRNKMPGTPLIAKKTKSKCIQSANGQKQRRCLYPKTAACNCGPCKRNTLLYAKGSRPAQG